MRQPISSPTVPNRHRHRAHYQTRMRAHLVRATSRRRAVLPLCGPWPRRRDRRDRQSPRLLTADAIFWPRAALYLTYRCTQTAAESERGKAHSRIRARLYHHDGPTSQHPRIDPRPKQCSDTSDEHPGPPRHLLLSTAPSSLCRCRVHALLHGRGMARSAAAIIEMTAIREDGAEFPPWSSPCLA